MTNRLTAHVISVLFIEYEIVLEHNFPPSGHEITQLGGLLPRYKEFRIKERAMLNVEQELRVVGDPRIAPFWALYHLHICTRVCWV